jgi:hypothetical protein
MPVVDADDPRRGWRLDRRRPDQAQQRVVADRHAQERGQARSALAALGERNTPLDVAEPGRAALSGRCRGGQTFGENPAWAGTRRAAKAADLQVQFDGAALPGQVRQPAVLCRRVEG